MTYYLLHTHGCEFINYFENEAQTIILIENIFKKSYNFLQVLNTLSLSYFKILNWNKFTIYIATRTTRVCENTEYISLMVTEPLEKF